MRGLMVRELGWGGAGVGCICRERNWMCGLCVLSSRVWVAPKRCRRLLRARYSRRCLLKFVSPGLCPTTTHRPLLLLRPLPQQNLQRLPALLERDQAAAFAAADISQPPPPGEADSPFWPRQEQQQQQHPQPEPATANQRLATRKVPEPVGFPTTVTATATSPSTSPGRRTRTQSEGGSTRERRTRGASESRVGGEVEAAAFKTVVAQLCRVISGCTQLLRLRDVIGEREERALSAMSERGSPVLLAAVEAYGADQNLEVRYFARNGRMTSSRRFLFCGAYSACVRLGTVPVRTTRCVKCILGAAFAPIPFLAQKKMERGM